MMGDHIAGQLEVPRRPVWFPRMTKPRTADPEVPIVELRPFSQKEWRRAKSLPAFWESKSLEFYSEDQESPRRQRFVPVTGTRIHLIPNDEICKLSPGETSLEYNKGLFKTQKQSPRESTAKFFEKPPKFGFATIEEREKTTLDEIKTGCSENIHYSFLKSAMSEENIAKRQDLMLRGQQIRDKSHSGHHFYMTNPRSSFYKLARSYTMPIGGHDLEFLTQNLYSNLRNTSTYCGQSMPVTNTRFRLVTQREDRIMRRSPEKTTLPLIEIRNAPFKTKPTTSHTEDSSEPVGQPLDSYRVGGIKNTLQVMNEIGKPTGIEHQLTMQINYTLEHLRRTKDNVPPSQASVPAPAPSLAGSIPRGRYSQRAPTQGEILLQEGLRQNARRAREKTITPSDASESSNQSRSSTSLGLGSENLDSGIQSPVNSGAEGEDPGGEDNKRVSPSAEPESSGGQISADQITTPMTTHTEPVEHHAYIPTSDHSESNTSRPQSNLKQGTEGDQNNNADSDVDGGITAENVDHPSRPSTTFLTSREQSRASVLLE